MATVATDDPGWRLRFVWLGHPNAPFPFEASGQAWAIACVLCPFLTVTIGTLLPKPVIQAVAPGPVGVLLTGVLAIVLGVAAGVLLTRKIGRALTPVRPLPHHTALLAAELAGPRDPGTTVHFVEPSLAKWVEDQPETRTTHVITAPTIKD